jgi:uncharacterized membrane protein YhhN
MLITILTALALVTAILTILASYQGRKLTLYLFKPLTIIFIIIIALQSKYSASGFYRYAIIAGLCLSLVGDVFLMLPSDRFIHGLVSFLLAHLCYVAAFMYESNRALSGLNSIPFLLYGLLMLRLLWPHLGKLKTPVIVYMLMILLMGWAAASRFLLLGQKGSLFAFAGAILFIISDSTLALDRFKVHFRSAQLLILSTYFTAQWLIALST